MGSALFVLSAWWLKENIIAGLIERRLRVPISIDNASIGFSKNITLFFAGVAFKKKSKTGVISVFFKKLKLCWNSGFPAPDDLAITIYDGNINFSKSMGKEGENGKSDEHKTDARTEKRAYPGEIVIKKLTVTYKSPLFKENFSLKNSSIKRNKDLLIYQLAGKSEYCQAFYASGSTRLIDLNRTLLLENLQLRLQNFLLSSLNKFVKRKLPLKFNSYSKVTISMQLQKPGKEYEGICKGNFSDLSLDFSDRLYAINKKPGKFAKAMSFLQRATLVTLSRKYLHPAKNFEFNIPFKGSLDKPFHGLFRAIYEKIMQPIDRKIKIFLGRKRIYGQN
ncbi:hypothetical protein ACFL35_00110 [Candidatus Riflebacteria bacterium]